MRKSFSRLVQLAGVGWRARCSESCTAGSGKGGEKRVLGDNALAAYFTHRHLQGKLRKQYIGPIAAVTTAGLEEIAGSLETKADPEP